MRCAGPSASPWQLPPTPPLEDPGLALGPAQGSGAVSGDAAERTHLVDEDVREGHQALGADDLLQQDAGRHVN